MLEAGIDFAEDDVDVLPGAEILSRIEEIRGLLQPVADSFPRGRIVHAGLMLAIVGRPNAGKSSLFNRIVQRERAIVTAAPGTTRDLVTERVSLGGIPVELVDTAGMREARMKPSRLGFANRARRWPMQTWCCWCWMRPWRLSRKSWSCWQRWRSVGHWWWSTRVIWPHPSAAMEEALGGLGLPVVHTSALSGEGVGELKQKMLAMVGDRTAETESGMLTSLRQYQAVTATLEALAAAVQRPDKTFLTRWCCWIYTERCAISTRSPAKPPATTS